MPKYAILSDIHSNLEALTAVLDKCRVLDSEMRYISLGDIVGYNANPRECLDIVRGLNCVSMVLGNHDEYVGSDDEGMEGFNPSARAAVLWTRKHLTEEERRYVSSTRYRELVYGTNITLVHATLDSPEQWGYIFDLHHAISNFSYQFSQVCFCGHSHIPAAFQRNSIDSGGGDRYSEITSWLTGAEENFEQENASEVKLEVGHKYLFNIGSIGQPRSRDPRASFAVYDTSAMTVTRYRIPYDIATAQQKVLKAGLPERLAVRLALGA